MFKLFLHVLQMCVCIAFIIPSFAQISSDDAIESIKENGLIVRLNSNQLKLQALSDILDEGNISAGKKNRVQEEYDRALAETESDLKHIIQSFDSLYTFSKVFFIPDTGFRNAGFSDVHLVIQDGELFEKSIKKDFSDFIFCYFDYGDYKSLRLRHSDFNPTSSEYLLVQSPFPSKIKSAAFFRNLFRPFLKNAHLKDISTVVKKLNQRLDELD